MKNRKCRSHNNANNLALQAKNNVVANKETLDEQKQELERALGNVQALQDTAAEKAAAEKAKKKKYKNFKIW